MGQLTVRRAGMLGLASRPFLADALLALALAAVSVPGLFFNPDQVLAEPREPDVLGVLLSLASCAPVAWRRRRPLRAFLACLLPSLALAAMGYAQAFGGLPVVVLLYSVAVHRGRAPSLLALAIAALAGVVAIASDPFDGGLADYLATLAVFVAAWAVGRSLRIRRAYVSELESKTLQMAATREADTRAALAEERSRIARELHDVVAHHVSVMTVQAAGAQRALERDPAAARTAMASVETTGRAALVEMRRLVGVLQGSALSDHGELAPQPGLDQVELLAEQVRHAGLPVAVRIVGAARPLEPGVGLTAYRIVQEGLTNALRHAGRAHAVVTLTYRERDIAVEVLDDGRGAAASAPVDGRPGHGLVGMRERVAVYGGRLEVGPRGGGGFAVRAILPAAPAPWGGPDGRAEIAGSEPPAVTV